MPKTNPFVVLWTRFLTSWLAANLSVCRCFCGHSSAARRLGQKEWSESVWWRVFHACIIAICQAQDATFVSGRAVDDSKDSIHTLRVSRLIVRIHSESTQAVTVWIYPANSSSVTRQPDTKTDTALLRVSIDTAPAHVRGNGSVAA